MYLHHSIQQRHIQVFRHEACANALDLVRAWVAAADDGALSGLNSVNLD